MIEKANSNRIEMSDYALKNGDEAQVILHMEMVYKQLNTSMREN